MIHLCISGLQNNLSKIKGGIQDDYNLKGKKEEDIIWDIYKGQGGRRSPAC